MSGRNADPKSQKVFNRDITERRMSKLKEHGN